MGSPSVLSSPAQGASAGEFAMQYARQDHPRYKTKRCKHDLRGTCPFGDSCSYIHTSQRMFFTPSLFPTAVHGYPGHATVPVRLQDAVMQAVSPYMFAISHEEPRPALAAPAYVSPTVPVDIDEAFRALSVADGPQRQRKGASSGGRACHYRTKPCKFYHMNGRCAKGNRCNFIHDSTVVLTPAEPETDSSFDVFDSSSDSGESSLTRENHREEGGAHGAQVTSSEEAAQERGNFYPITWRIIGGGVKMSGPRETCEDFMAGRCNEGPDCKFWHPSAIEEEEPVEITETPVNPYYASGVSPTSPVQFLPVPRILLPPPTRREYRRGSVESPKRMARIRHDDNEKLRSGSTLLPVKPSDGGRSEGETSVSHSQPARKFHPQHIPRPLSTPPSITASGFKITQLFSAESP